MYDTIKAKHKILSKMLAKVDHECRDPHLSESDYWLKKMEQSYLKGKVEVLGDLIDVYA